MLFDYSRNFIENGDQFIALGCVALVWIGMMAIGAALRGPERLREIDHLIGWSVASLFFTGFGVFTTLAFPFIAALGGAIAAAALFVAFRPDHGFGTPALARALLLALPLVLLTAAMKGSQWDEFTDWLVIPRYMLETQAFPSASNPYPNATFSGYPYSWHYISYLASLIGGQLLESAGALSNVFLLIGASTLLVRLVGQAIGDDTLHRHPGWGLCAFAVLAMTLINPTFAQKVVLTAYADTASAVVTGTATIVAWFCIEALVAKDNRSARKHAISLGLLLMLLVNLKQATLVLALLIAGGFYVIALRDSSVRFLSALKLSAYIILPPVIIFLIWRYQLHSDPAKVRELSIAPFSDWLIHLIPQILTRMGLILSKKGYYLALLLILIGAGLRGLWCSKTPADRLAALSMGIVLGYNAFLLFAYVTTFGKNDALRAASYWRYSMHLGMIIVAFSVFGLAKLWHERLSDRVNITRVQWLAVVLILIAPFVFAKKLRFDRVPMTVHFRMVGASVSNRLGPDDKVFVVDPLGSGESSAILGFELRSGAKRGGYVGAFHTDRLSPVAGLSAQKDITAVIVYSQLPEYQDLFHLTFQPKTSYLLERGLKKGWQIIETWPQPR